MVNHVNNQERAGRKLQKTPSFSCFGYLFRCCFLAVLFRIETRFGGFVVRQFASVGAEFLPCGARPEFAGALLAGD